jgi:hypothetical protein|tara:strand:+ start:2039 stop:2353 length:315 start_codon:yes stop_codon:yes gene_type:complete
VLVEEVEEELALMMISSRHPFPAEEEAEAEEALHHFFLASLPVLLRVEGVEAAVEEEQEVEVQVQMGAFLLLLEAIFSAEEGAEEGEQMKTSAAEAKEPEAVSR